MYEDIRRILEESLRKMEISCTVSKEFFNEKLMERRG